MSLDVRKIINFTKNKMMFPILILFLFLVLITLSLVFGWSKNKTAPQRAGGSKSNEQSFFSVNAKKSKINYDDFDATDQRPAPAKKRVPSRKSIKKPLQRRSKPHRITIGLPPIVNIYSAPPKKFEGVSDDYAPFGRLIECQLVMTIDSATAETPIIGLVTADLIHNNKVIIPAGSEIHGHARGKPIRDRVMTDSDWVVVWRTRSPDNGLELKLKGIALTMETMYTPNSWNVNDGSAGIRGEVVKSTKMEELVAYAADFLAVFTDQLVQEQVIVTDWGQTSTNSGDANDAFNKGISSAVRKYADKLLDEVNKNGYFVRCSGGTRFYLYVQQTIDLETAKIAVTNYKDYKIRRNRR